MKPSSLDHTESLHGVESITKITKTRYNVAKMFVSQELVLTENKLTSSHQDPGTKLALKIRYNQVFTNLINKCCDHPEIWEFLVKFLDSLGASNEIQEQDPLLWNAS